MHRALYDLKLAVAQSGHTLLADEPDIDREGFDLKLSLHPDHLHIQCKTVGPSKGANSWNVRADMLRPRAEDVSQRRVGGLNLPSGLGGGLLVARITMTEEQAATPGGELTITYHYLDLMTLWALAEGLVRKKPDVQRDARELLEKLRSNATGVKVPRRLLVEARDPASLVALMGLEGLHLSFWRANLGHMWSDASEGGPADTLPPAIVNQSVAQLRSFCADLL